MINRAVVVGVIVAVTLGWSGPATAQSPMVEAKALYDNASYDDALKLLDQIAATENVPEVQQYRVLCLVALGRVDAAASAIALVVAADPFFTPDPDDVAPRVVAMFTASRRKLLPSRARRAFAEATALFKAGDSEGAAARFDEVLRLLNDPVLKEDRDLADLMVVATGFADLVRAQRPVQPVRAAAADAPVPLPPSPEPAAVEMPKPPVATLPVALTQVLPQWDPPDAATARRAFSGAIRLSIDKDGKVTAATRERAVHPAYDAIVLDAARRWLYKPATLNGEPVASQATVEIRLKPSED